MRPATTAGVMLGVATAVLRLPRAFGDAFWQDEVASARVIREPTFVEMLRHVVRTESTPPFWYSLAWAAHRAGVSIHDVRLLSVVFDGLLVFLVVRLAARFLPLVLAAAAGALVAVGAEFSFHGRELRAYELFALLVVAFALALAATVRSPTRLRLVGLGAATTAGLLTHYFFAFTLLAGLAWLWLEPQARVARRRATTAVAVGVLACAPWLPMFVAQFRHDRFSWIGPFDGREVLETPLRLFAPSLASPWTGALSLLVLAAGAVAAWRGGPLQRLCACLAVVPLLLAALTWLAGVRVFAVRNMVGIGPFVAVVLVLPLVSQPARRRAALAFAVVGAAFAVFVTNQHGNPPFQAIAAALVREGWAPRDPVVVQANVDTYRSPLEWYLPHVPVLEREPLRDLQGAAAVYAVLPRRSLPVRLDARGVRVGVFLVARIPSRGDRRWVRHDALLAVARPALEPTAVRIAAR